MRVQQSEALRESEERFRGAFEAAAIGFAIVELDGRVREVNASLCAMLGYSRTELMGMTFHEITHPDDIPLNAPLRERLLAGAIDSFHLEKRYLHKQGRIVWAVLTVSLVRDVADAPAYFVSQIVDITARRAAEEESLRHAAELERSNAALQRYAYVASHDLHEPLRTIRSFAQLLAESYRDRLDARADRWIDFIVHGVERMQRVIDDLLMLARVGTEGGSLEATDTDDVVVRSWARLRDRHPGLDGTLVRRALPVVMASPAQLEQLFQNLLGNAIKYRRPRVPLVVEVSAARADGGARAMWEFAVHDNGIGFDMAHAERIFEIFQRLHREDQYEGAGIGLAICRSIVEAYGGHIRGESVPGEGAVFRFTLPAGAR
jgi:PAS domain S-box-containing protein